MVQSGAIHLMDIAIRIQPPPSMSPPKHFIEPLPVAPEPEVANAATRGG